MQRITLPERSDWKSKAEELGFHFHTMYGEPYWDETSAYAFTLEQIETDIEAPSSALHAMCLEAVDAIVASEELMSRLGIPGGFHDLVAGSWTRRDPALYGRLDLAYDGAGPAKLLEYNADTPTSLYEAASFQWIWLEDMRASGALPADADQFNGIHEAMVAGGYAGRPVYSDAKGGLFSSDGRQLGFAGSGSTMRGTPAALRAPALSAPAAPMTRATVSARGGFGAARTSFGG